MQVLFYMPPEARHIRKYFIIYGGYRKCQNYALLTNTGKLSGTAQIADYHSYNVKVAELLETHTLLSVVM